MNPQQYAVERQDEFLGELIDWLKISSISTTPDHKTDVWRAADWLARHMADLGLETQTFETPGNPIVFGQWLRAGPSAPTVLVYGHYDVQPPDPLDAWQTPPFEPSVRNGNLYARGAADDKGQVFIHLKAAQSMLQATGTLPVNLKFVVEGEEEVGSPNLKAFVESHRDLLAADVAVISDTHGNGLDQPTIIYALRGLVYMELEVRGPATDLHSGIFGGAVHNPAQALCEIIARLHDPDGRIAVPGFYDRVRALDDEERAEIARLPYSDEDVRRETGAPASWGRGRVYAAGASRGASHVGDQRYRRRLDRPGRQDGDPCQGAGKGKLPPGARSGPAGNLRPDSRLCGADHAADRDQRSSPVAGPTRTSCDGGSPCPGSQGSYCCLRGRVGRAAYLCPRRRFDPGGGGFPARAWRAGDPDGLRPAGR